MSAFTSIILLAAGPGKADLFEGHCVTATALLDGCEISGEIVHNAGVNGSLSPLRAVVTMSNPTNESRKLSCFIQVISQDSKAPKNVFIFREGSYEMTIAPHETVVRDFPFIDFMASMPIDYMKDTVSIRIGGKRFERYGERIAIKPDEKADVGEGAATIALWTEGRPGAQVAPVREGQAEVLTHVCTETEASETKAPDGFKVTPKEAVEKARRFFPANPFVLTVYADAECYYVARTGNSKIIRRGHLEKVRATAVKFDGRSGKVVSGVMRPPAK